MARIKLGDMMVKAGLIDELQLNSALAVQRQWGGKLGDVLVNNGFIDEMMLWKGLSHQLGVPLVCLPDEKLPPGIQKILPLELCQKHSIFPIGRDDKTVLVATSDPNNISGIDEVTFRVGARVKIVLAPDREIEWAIRVHYLGDSAPCPPPKTRRALTPNDPQMATMQQAAQASLGLGQSAQTSPAELAATLGQQQAAQQAAWGGPPQATQPPSQLPQQAPWWAQAGVQDGEVAIRETAHLLRFVVEACVQRGVFTREEYLAKLRAQG